MAHTDDKKRELRRAYVFDRMTLTMAALHVALPEGTARRWKRDAKEQGDDWDNHRTANLMAGEGLDAMTRNVVEEFVIQFQVTIENIKDDHDMKAGDKVKHMASLADAFNKVVAAAGRISPKLSELGIATDVLQRLARFIAANHPELGPNLVEVLEPFANELAEAYK